MVNHQQQQETLEQPGESNAFTPATFVKLLDEWSSRNDISVSYLLEYAGMARSSATWWRRGVLPSRGTQRLIELSMATLEKRRRKKAR